MPERAEATQSPELVAAHYALGSLDETSVPSWAAWWVIDGHDGPAVVELAGLAGDDPFDVREALMPAFSELDVTVPHLAQAWEVVATDLAAKCLAGRLAG